MTSTNQYEDRRHLRGVPEEITRRAAPDVQEYIRQMGKWLPARRNLISKLNGIADEIDEINKATNYANVTGSITAVTGASVLLGCLFLPVVVPAIPFCAAFLSATGSLTSAGSKIFDTMFQRVKIKEAERLIEEEKVIVEKIKTAVENIQRVARQAAPSLQHMNLEEITFGILMEGLSAMGHAVVMLDVADDIVNMSAALMDVVLLDAGALVSTGQALVGAVGKTLLVVSIPLTLHSMSVSLRQLSGETASASQNLRITIQKMKEEYQQMHNMYNHLPIESARYR